MTWKLPQDRRLWFQKHFAPIQQMCNQAQNKSVSKLWQVVSSPECKSLIIWRERGMSQLTIVLPKKSPKRNSVKGAILVLVPATAAQLMIGNFKVGPNNKWRNIPKQSDAYMITKTWGRPFQKRVITILTTTVQTEEIAKQFLQGNNPTQYEQI